LLQSLALERPTRPRIEPAWDLSLVLEVLNGDNFEPLAKVYMKYLAFKTAFLLALAIASRVSELHAIDVDIIRFGENWRDVSFAPSMGFLSKTQTPEDTQRALARVTVKSLCETVDDRMSDDRKLCPIRALRREYQLQRCQSGSQIHSGSATPVRQAGIVLTPRSEHMTLEDWLLHGHSRTTFLCCML
jgi:hypothetical protein